MNIEWTDTQWQRRFNLVYRCELNALYHRKRERHYSILDKLAKALTLVAGTAAFSALLPSAEAKSYAGLAVAVVSIPSLVMSWSDKARLHNELAAEYTRIHADIVGRGVFGAEMADQFDAALVSLGSREPHSLSALVVECQNEIAAASGNTDYLTHLPFYAKWFSSWFDFPSVTSRR